jgi:hypothetical protein
MLQSTSLLIPLRGLSFFSDLSFYSSLPTDSPAISEDFSSSHSLFSFSPVLSAVAHSPVLSFAPEQVGPQIIQVEMI